MQWQDFLILALTAVGSAFGWLLKLVWSAINELRRDLKVLPDVYARRDDMHVIVETLRRIEDKLDRKADK